MKFLRRQNTNNLMLINVIYHQPSKYNNWQDCLDIIYKDTRTGEKFLECIENPPMEVYFTKPEYRTYEENQNFMDIEKTYPVICSYKDLVYDIAKELGPEYSKMMSELTKQKRFAERKNIHHNKYVFGSDMDIENWYRIHWELEYGNDDDKKITKSFLDIEIDAIDIPEGYGQPGECPINAVTIIDDDSNTVYTFLLRNDKNPQIAEFEANIKQFVQECHDDFDEFYGVMDYRIYMYDREIDLIVDIFKLINTIKPDFCMIWNMAYDIPYIIARLQTLGYDPVDIMCHKDFVMKELFYKKDTRNFKIENKSDYFKISSYTAFLDQMILYAALRKGQSELRSNTLSYISQVELNDDKLDYSEEANMKTFAYVNYWKFVKYNIKDVLLQLGIERKTNDIENIYIRSVANVTPYNKIFKQTVFLMDRAYLEYYKQGVIIGNNLNIHYGIDEEDIVEVELELDDDDETTEVESKDKKFAGALVADPELNDYMGIEIMGVRSKYAFNNVVDMDFSSMYPNIIIPYNNGPHAMIGKVISRYIPPEKVDEEKYDAGQDLVDNMLIDNPLNFGTKWLDLPDGITLDEMIREEFNI